MTWTSRNVEEFIAARGLHARVVVLPASTHTAEDSARALGTDLAHIAKSLLAKLADGRFVLCIVRGDKRLDRKKLCRAAGAKTMTLAKAEEVLAVTGYPVGAVPPFALQTDLPTYIDEYVLGVDTVFCGGGAVDTLVEVRTDELKRVTQGQAVDLVLEPS